MISKPQKAPSKPITNEELSALSYPVYGSPKLDGYRCTVQNGVAYTSSMKPVTNKYIQNYLGHELLNGFDGELIVGEPNDPNVFNNTTGPVRRVDGKPKFVFYVFDDTSINSHYSMRYENLSVRCMNVSEHPVVAINQRVLRNAQEVLDYEAWCVEQGFEGAMIRTMNAPYKEGRCTFRELNIFKRKPVEDDEAEIIGFEEQMENNNEQFRNELGNSVRSAHQENKVGKNTLGNFICQSKKFSMTFRIGTGLGLTDKLRKIIWYNQEHYKGLFITYKYQAHGSIAAPRQPIFKGFRDISDMTNY